VALTVANRLAAAFSDGALFVDLTPSTDPTLVASTLASALGLPVFAADPMPAILSSLRHKQMLIVLDNCEYVLDAIAHVAEKMLRGAPNLCVIATSREPLRAEGEWVRRLRPLEIPPPGSQANAADARSFAAVELFVERACACDDTFVMQDADVPLVAKICRKLDGNPLAIELAAARIELFGLRGLAAGLEDRLHLLAQGRRTAPLRHRTLRATLDWSFQLLPPRQQIILRRLGVFHGAFDIEAVCAVLEDAEIGRNDLLDAVADFIAKSLMVVNATDETVTYQLLETVRAYVVEQLAHSDDYRSIRYRHAEWCCVGAIASSMNSIDELRLALEWCFFSEGDAKLGVKLTAVSAPVWFRHALVEEYRVRAERAVKFLDEFPGHDPAIELQLRAALGDALLHTRGPVPEMVTVFGKALQLAEGLDSPMFRRRALWGLWLERISQGDYASALQMAHQLQSASHGDHLAVAALNERIMAVALHFKGVQRGARDHAERSLALSRDEPIPTGIESAFQYCCARAVLARALWIQGFPEQAVRMAHESVEHLRTGPAAMTLCYALACASAVFLWTGDTATAARYAAMLIEHATRLSLYVSHREVVGRIDRPRRRRAAALVHG
jgi:predicted ATPase